MPPSFNRLGDRLSHFQLLRALLVIWQPRRNATLRAQKYRADQYIVVTENYQSRQFKRDGCRVQSFAC